MMNDKEVIQKLNSLIQLDIDAVRAYTQALEQIDYPEVKEHLTRFRADHERHITDLSIEVRSRGGEPPKPTPDLKGFFIEKFTSLRSVTGTEGALKAMQTNEELTNRTYKKALEAGLPEGVRQTVEENYNDEQRHLTYIVNALAARVWETRKAG